MAIPVEENTPLLRSYSAKKTPLPWGQLSLILFLQLAEPLTSHVIYPFAPQLIRDTGITHGDETQVAYYVGILESVFFLTQALTIFHWSRTSDQIGRKPVILTGLFGLSVSMYAFGLSKSFWGLVFSRSLNGALNGNIGPIKSMMVDITDETNIAQAFGYFPLPWGTGGIIGPIIGGSLSRPAEQFPDIFGSNDFLKKYPYFLPCAIPATFTVIAWTVTFFFLKETVKNPVPISRFLHLSKRTPDPQTPHSGLSIISDYDETLPIRALLTPRVITAAGNYAFLSLVDITFRVIQPVFLSTPIPLGGLGLPPSVIGMILSAYGILGVIFQAFFFAKINDYLGPKSTFVTGIAFALPAFMCFPILSWLAKAEGLHALVWAVVAFQVMLSVGMNISYGAVFMFIAASSPNKASLGATNGLSQMIVSMMRAIGPAAANSMFSLSIQKGYLGGYLVYYFLMVIVCIALFAGSLLPEKVSRQ